MTQITPDLAERLYQSPTIRAATRYDVLFTRLRSTLIASKEA